MKITEDRLAVARAVYDLPIMFVPHDREELLRDTIESLPEPPDDSPATLPAPTCDGWWWVSIHGGEWQMKCVVGKHVWQHAEGVSQRIAYGQWNARWVGPLVSPTAKGGSVPAPPGVGVCCMCDAKIPVACKDCLDYARESVGLPAPDVAIPICPPGRGPQELPAPTAKGGAK